MNPDMISTAGIPLLETDSHKSYTFHGANTTFSVFLSSNSLNASPTAFSSKANL